MQKLHLVGVTADRQGLIFSRRRGSKSGGFVVPLSDGVLETIDALRSGEEVAAVVDEEPRPVRQESALSVREVQARLRVGRSIAQVAKEAGVDQDWVERFAVPVIAEQRRVIGEAQALHLDKRGRGASALPLGAAVRRNVGAKGVAVTDEEFADAWSAHQLHDSRWIVRFRYRSRGHDQEAAWEYDQATASITSRERLGTTLGFVEEGSENDASGPARRGSARRRSTTKPKRKRAAKKNAGASKTPAAKRAADRKKAPARKKAAARKKAPARKKAAARTKAAAKKPASAAKKAPLRKAPATKAATRKKASAARSAPAG